MGAPGRVPRVPAELKGAAKRGLRGYGVMTARFRTLPDFLIIGAKRGASTSLWNAVVAHPDTMPMFPARLKIKGTGFFSVNYAKGEAWYRSFFPTHAARSLRKRRNGSPPRAGEATPYYLFHPHAPARAGRVVPEAKVIVILRNPVDRAYSHYRERVRNGAEILSFEDALGAEEQRLAGEEERLLADEGYQSFEHEHHSYVAQGRYADPLVRWQACFDPSRLLVVLNEDFGADRDRELARIWLFLDLRPWTPPPLKRYNYHEGQPMRAATRERLLAEFRPHNRRLEELLGIDLSGWDR